MLFSELFHQGQYTVPWHQRYYDWKPGDVRALLHDVNEAIKEDRDCYFLGAIILVETNTKQWEINDGQQRMVTVSLIHAALCRRFHEARSSQREGLALRILFDLDTVNVYTLDDAENYSPRVSPPKNDTMRYHQILRGNTIGTNGILTVAWAEIEKFFSAMSLKQQEQYFDFLLGKIEVACLRIPPHVDSNAVYETINCRGKKLDDLDLIRNHLYSHFNAKSDIERRVSVHENLERIRTQIDRVNKASEYMRCQLQCRFGFLRKDNFYRDVRKSIRANKSRRRSATGVMADYVFNLTKQIASPEDLELYRMLINPAEEFIKAFKISSGTTKSRRNLAVFLRELGGYTVTQPLVFAMLKWYIRESDGRKKRRIAKIANKNLSRLATFVLRTAFVAPKFEPSHFETEFSNHARDITKADDIPDTEFAEFLRDCDRSKYNILDNSKFRDAMVDVRMIGVSKIKQFLLGINGSLQKDAELLNARLCSIEHILPKSPQHWGGWSAFDDIDAGEWVHRVGNLTLMGPTDNKPGSKFNGNFAKKRESYENSGIRLTRNLSKYNDWTPATIEARQKKMVDQSVRVWTFD